MNLILVAVDGSDASERAVLRAADRAKERDAEVVVLHVLPTTFERQKVAALEPSRPEVEESFARDVVDRAVSLLAERGVRGQGRVLGGAPAQAIIEQIRELRPLLVVMGTRGESAVMPEGSVSRRVRARSEIEVEIVD